MTGTLGLLRHATVEMAQRAAREAVREALDKISASVQPEPLPLVDRAADDAAPETAPASARLPTMPLDPANDTMFDRPETTETEDPVAHTSCEQACEPDVARHPSGSHGAVPIVPASQRSGEHDGVPSSILNILKKQQRSNSGEGYDGAYQSASSFQSGASATDSDQMNTRFNKILDRIAGRLK